MALANIIIGITETGKFEIAHGKTVALFDLDESGATAASATLSAFKAKSGDVGIYGSSSLDFPEEYSVKPEALAAFLGAVGLEV